MVIIVSISIISVRHCDYSEVGEAYYYSIEYVNAQKQFVLITVILKSNEGNVMKNSIIDVSLYLQSWLPILLPKIYKPSHIFLYIFFIN